MSLDSEQLPESAKWLANLAYSLNHPSLSASLELRVTAVSRSNSSNYSSLIRRELPRPSKSQRRYSPSSSSPKNLLHQSLPVRPSRRITSSPARARPSGHASHRPFGDGCRYLGGTIIAGSFAAFIFSSHFNGTGRHRSLCLPRWRQFSFCRNHCHRCHTSLLPH